jgi:hypothetical protein
VKLESLKIEHTSVAGGLQNVFQIKSLLRLSLDESLSRTGTHISSIFPCLLDTYANFMNIVRVKPQEASSVPAPTIGKLPQRSLFDVFSSNQVTTHRCCITGGFGTEMMPLQRSQYLGRRK